MRSLLFVPGADERKLARAADCGADVLVLDLEDSVAPPSKPAARERVAAFIEAHRALRVFVRVNAFDTGWLLEDLAAVVRAQPCGIVLPKCVSETDLPRLAAYLDVLEVREGLAPGGIQVLPIATESAQAVLTLMQAPIRPGPRLCGLLWGGEDLAADVMAVSNRRADGTYTDAYRLSRSLTLLQSVAAGVPAVDAVYTDFRDLDGLRREAQEACRDGFTAKAAIHPDQIPVIHEVFQPSAQALAQARRVMAAFESEPGAGAVSLDGSMLDRPHLNAARRLLDRVAGSEPA